ncbi:MAG: ABC transporter substrate-binding protein [Clostridiales bacterium]|nr:ABC transporter substrate-binding protein [Clostridiales bacterium]
MKNRNLLILLSIILMFAVTGCNSSQPTVKDREGNDIILPEKINRIISTIPSNTEILVALGLKDKIIAVDNYSKDVEGINPDVTFIDLMNPDAETIIELNPDIIIASEINKMGGRDPFSLLKESGITVVYVPISDSIQGIYDDIIFIGEITKTSEKATEIIENMKKEIENYRKIGETITEKKRVYFEISPAPDLFTFGKGSFLQEILEIVGADNVFADKGKGIAISSEAILEANPEVILTNVNYIDNPIEEIKSRDGWNSITAVATDQVHYIDANSSSRPSQNIVNAIKEIGHAIYPELYE